MQQSDPSFLNAAVEPNPPCLLSFSSSSICARPGSQSLRIHLHSVCPFLVLTRPPPNPYLPQAQFALDQARKAYAAAPALTALLPREERLSAAGLRGFRLGSLSQCVYVDPAGRQHNVAPQVRRGRVSHCEELFPYIVNPRTMVFHLISYRTWMPATWTRWPCRSTICWPS